MRTNEDPQNRTGNAAPSSSLPKNSKNMSAVVGNGAAQGTAAETNGTGGVINANQRGSDSGKPNANPTGKVNGSGNKRKPKKPPRPGNPSGVPWMQHWDAQAAHEEGGREAGGLYYEEDDTLVAGDATTAGAPLNANPPKGNGGGNKPKASSNTGTLSRFDSTKKLPPAPPSSSFIGPTLPFPGPGAPTALPLQKDVGTPRENTVGPRDSIKTGKSRNRRTTGKKNETAIISMAHEEEWDDSVLIDAWNAAEEEYRVSELSPPHLSHRESFVGTSLDDVQLSDPFLFIFTIRR